MISLRFLPCAALAAVLLLDVGPSHADTPPGRYTAQNGTVLDTKTKLTWQQDVAPGLLDWVTAKSYCFSLSLSGGGWRLPSMKELLTLVDETRKNPALDPQFFPGTMWMHYFWSSSSYAFSPANSAWNVSFSDGITATNSKSLQQYVRCVR